MVGFIRNVSVATLMLLAPGMALAQPAAGTKPGASDPAAVDPSVPAGSASATPAAPAPPKIPATGYGYGGTPAARGPAPRTTVHRARAKPSFPVATYPGFEMLADGGSRMFVQLTKSVAVEEKRAAGSITYVLKGAHVVQRNNRNALVTVHFNTPAARARLVPVGNDVHFIVEMRANVEPHWKVDAAKDNTALLNIDFPKGEFLGDVALSPTPTTRSATPSTMTRAARRTIAPIQDTVPEPVDSAEDTP